MYTHPTRPDSSSQCQGASEEGEQDGGPLETAGPAPPCWNSREETLQEGSVLTSEIIQYLPYLAVLDSLYGFGGKVVHIQCTSNSLMVHVYSTQCMVLVGRWYVYIAIPSLGGNGLY